jgi:DNA-binding MarR family transcriptional regulator
MQHLPSAATHAHPRAAKPPSTPPQTAALPLLHTFTGAVIDLCRNENRDLSSRQLGVLLTVATKPGPHTVRGMAAALGVNKPSITRALDVLGELNLVKRQIDPADRRSVLAILQPAGSRAVRELGDSLRGHAAVSGEA